MSDDARCIQDEGLRHVTAEESAVFKRALLKSVKVIAKGKLYSEEWRREVGEMIGECAHGVSTRDPCQECVQRSEQAFGCEHPDDMVIERIGGARQCAACGAFVDRYISGVGIVRGLARYEAGSNGFCHCAEPDLVGGFCLRCGDIREQTAEELDADELVAGALVRTSDQAAPNKPLKTRITEYEQSPQYQDLVRDVASGEKSIGQGVSEAYEAGVTDVTQKKEAGP